MIKIAPAAVRYIKLGEKGSWTALCVERGELRLGFRDVPHDLCAAGDWEAVRQVFLVEGRTPSAASRFVGELKDFYERDGDCLWVTFHDDRLWWAFAEGSVAEVEGEEPYRGARLRKVRDGWRSTDILGADLICPLLSGPSFILAWPTKEAWNGRQEARRGTDYRQVA